MNPVTIFPLDSFNFHFSSRSSSLASLSKNGPSSPFQNLTNLERSRSNTPSALEKSSTDLPNGPNYNRLQICSAAEAYLKACAGKSQYNDENNGYDLMTRSLTCARSSDLDNIGHDFDMSQSLIVAKTTTTEYLQMEKISPSPKKMKPPSPAFNRNPRYEQKKAQNGCSYEDMRRLAESKRRQVQEERLKEQEIERQEKVRLEEILAMCAEYEKQSTVVEKPRQR